MRKRFTDSDKWQKMWFRTLTTKEKALWFYCSEVVGFDGILEADPEAIEFYTGFKGEIPEVIKEKLGFIEVDTNQYLLKNWLRFQYKELKENVATHKRIISRLREKGLDAHFPELVSSF